MSFLTLDHIDKRFGDVQVLTDLSLSVARGEVLALLGLSGSGKTTALRLIAGFETPDAGRIVVDGQAVTGLPPAARDFGMVFQHYALFPHMTVAQNVAFGLETRGMNRDALLARVREVLGLVDLEGYGDRRIDAISGGQQQRVALARAVAVQPKVMLLDEPLSNLDANLREEMRNEIKRMHLEFGVTTVYVTHDQAEAMAISDRIAVVNAGRIEQVDAPFELYARPRTRFAAEFIGRTNLVTGQRVGGDMRFPAFSVSTGNAGPDGAVLASIRPQNLKITPRNGAAQRAAPGEVVLAARVEDRTFLGERWDYGLALEGVEGEAGALRAAAPAEQIRDVDAPVWVSIREERVVPVEDLQ